jgi:hypothetical protein
MTNALFIRRLIIQVVCVLHRANSKPMLMFICRKPASKSVKDKDRSYIHEVLVPGKRKKNAISVNGPTAGCQELFGGNELEGP